MKHKLLPFLMLFIFGMAACSKSLVSDIYKHTSEDNKDSLTAFVILSNMYLSEDEIEKIEKDYRMKKIETDSTIISIYWLKERRKIYT